MKKIASLALIAMILLAPAASIRAQSEGDIRVSLVTTLETPEAMLIKVYFNLIDPASGRPVLLIDTKSAQITVLNSGFVSPAAVKEPDVPIYVTLVLDSSGSMGGAASRMQEAARLALNNTPNNSLFSVVQFDEDIKLLQDFTENLSAVERAIDQYQVSNKGTCLYDAAYSAVETQSEASAGRRAVILFTDGKDETFSGDGCSQHSYQELVELASEVQVSIHTIGLSGPGSQINEVELKNMANSTGGFAFVASQADLGDAFNQIMEALRAQWMAEASVYPREGRNEGVLSLTFSNNNTASTTFEFESETGYSGPASPVQVELSGLQLIADTQTYEVQLTMTSPEMVRQIEVALWDKDAGSIVDEYLFTNPKTYNTLTIPTDLMTEEREYELRISAISKEDNTPFMIAVNERGDASDELVHEFRFEPASVYASAEIESVSREGRNISLSVRLRNPGLIGGFNGWLVDEETNTKVPNSNFNHPAISQSSGKITINLENIYLADGKYTIVLRVLGKNGQALTSTQYEGVSYQLSSSALTIVSVRQDRGNLVLNINVAQAEMIGGIEGWLVDKSTNTQVKNSDFSVPASAASEGKIVIPTRSQRIPSGKYSVVVRVLDTDDRVMMSTQYDEVSYRAPSFFARVGGAFIAQPLFIVLVAAIIGGVAAYVAISSRRKPQMSGTPVMQGELGGKIKQEPDGERIAAIADIEPHLEKKKQVSKPPGFVSEEPAPPAVASRKASSVAPTRIDSNSHYGQAAETAAPEGKPYLEGLTGMDKATLLVDSFPFTMGRADDNDLVLSDLSISRKHAVITRDEQENYYLTDLNSSNGTLLEGQKLAPDQPQLLYSGMKFQLGSNVSCRFEIR